MVICSILETTAEATDRRLRSTPAACALVEIRGDHLERADLVRLVRGAGRPLVVTVRRTAEGGFFEGSEEQRRRMLCDALAAGARFLDVEHDSDLRDLAEGPSASRVILSHHGAVCRPGELAATYAAMTRSSAARLKIVPHAGALAEAGAVRDLLARAARDGRSLACFASGRAGAITRLLAPRWGSWATYGSHDPTVSTAAGQFPVGDMLGAHGVLGIRSSTRRFALLGRSVFASPSPAMHRAGYGHAGVDARYFPVEADEFEEYDPLLEPGGILGLQALAVTMPFKEAAFRRCSTTDEVARDSGSVNTVRIARDGWAGYNTDGPAMLQLVRPHVPPEGARAAIVGAGGTARTAAVVLRNAGAEVRIFNRTESRARKVARDLGVQAGAWDELAEHRWDVLIQATPLGAAGERILPAESLTGSLVLDAVYGARTPLAADALQRGLRVVEGFELLVAQAVLQFERMTGRSIPADVLAEAGRAWLQTRGRCGAPA